jgi:hypothetical protein
MQTNIALAIYTTDQLLVSAVDDGGVTLDAVGMTGFYPGAGEWGTGVWGTGVWGAAAPYLRELPVPWNLPLVFRQVSLSVTAGSAAGQQIGNIYAKAQPVPWNYALQ